MYSESLVNVASHYRKVKCKLTETYKYDIFIMSRDINFKN